MAVSCPVEFLDGDELAKAQPLEGSNAGDPGKRPVEFLAVWKYALATNESRFKEQRD